tara:strand:+ start:552 stop:755 length:204 start_codon:yes stop_codon:yes gene_type:complete
MLDIAYISSTERSEYTHFLEDGETPRMPGTTIELFIPDERRDDIDRNTSMRAELSDKIDAALTAAGV